MKFGPYQFDVNTRVLTRAGETITLTPKASEILFTLLVNAGQGLKRSVTAGNLARYVF